MTLIFLIITQMYTDSLIAFKVGLTTSFGIFLVAFISMLFKDGRPFWDLDKINSNGNCFFSFAGPDIRQFILTFVCPYLFI
jgi:hypothetical protein